MNRRYLALFLATAACSSSDKPEERSDPDAGLTTPGAPDAGSAPRNVTPLPMSSFVFRRNTTPPSGLTTHSLYAYDAATKTEMLLTDLVDNGSGTAVSGHSISPDRKSLAFTAIFRPEPADFTQTPAAALWTVGVDGQGFARMTPPVFTTGGGGSCTTDSSCPEGQRCQLPEDVCREFLPVSVVEQPAWSADGTKIFFEIGHFSSVNGMISGGELPWQVASTGGIPTPVLDSFHCTIVSSLAPDPAGTGFLAEHAVCLPPDHDGLYFHHFDGSDPLEVASMPLNQIDPSLEPASWLDDGTGFVFAGQTTVTQGDQMVTAVFGLAAVLADGSLHIVASPNTAGQTVSQITVARDGTFAAYCLTTNGSPSTSDIYVIDLRASPATTYQATTDGKSCAPKF